MATGRAEPAKAQARRKGQKLVLSELSSLWSLLHMLPQLGPRETELCRYNPLYHATPVRSDSFRADPWTFCRETPPHAGSYAPSWSRDGMLASRSSRSVPAASGGKHLNFGIDMSQRLCS